MHTVAKSKVKRYQLLPANNRYVEVARGAAGSVVELSQRAGPLITSFVVCVCLPAIVAFLYLVVFASAQYESEARFAVRQADTRGTGAMESIAMMTSLTGTKPTSQDAFIVADYIRSRTIIDDLGGKDVLHRHFSKSGTDLFSRFSKSGSVEDALFYWRKKVTVVLDTQSSVLTLRVVSFSPEESQKLAEEIIKRSEALVNEISLRSRADTYARAEAEVQRALQRLSTMRAALLAFRTKSNTIDPMSSASSISETLATLTREKIALEANRATLMNMMAADSPSVRFITKQIDAVEVQIKALQDRLTSHVKGLETTASQLSDYEDLKLQSMFAEKLLELSHASLERARVEAEKQQLYVVTVVRPTFPEESKYPRPLSGTFLIFALCLVIWSMIALVVASIRDHMGG